MASARQIRDEIMTMKIVVNSDPAQKAIYELSKKTSDYKERNIELKESLKQTAASFGKNSEEYKKLTLELSQNKLAISANEKEMERLRSEMDISKMTMQQLRKEASLLRTNLDNMVPGSEQSRALQTQLTAVNARMAEVRTGANATGSSFQGLSRNFSHYTGLVTAGIATLVGFGLSVQKAIDLNNKLSDAQTAVAKTVNMTTDEVRSLTKEFQDFDTRTSKVDLLKIAETGGRLGIGKQQIKEFVREVDKANVALGDGFAGGVEAVTDTLGKLKNLYGETKELDMATAINQIGSAMNELGANGAASEQNIGEFALRIGSLPDKLKPTIAETLALGAAFEESGIDAERSSTAYSTFIRSAAVNAEKFAKVMNISKKEVEDLMNTDPLEFFLKFSEGAKGLETTELAKMLEYLKINDQFVIKSIGAASENTDRFRTSIDLSNKSLKAATSLQIEFDKVNNNLAGTFDKVKNKFSNIFTSQKVADTLNFLINAFALFIGVNEKAETEMSAFGKTFLTVARMGGVFIAMLFGLGAAIATYNLLLKESIARTIVLEGVQKIRNATTIAANSIQNIYNLTLGYAQLGMSKVIGLTRLQTTATNLQTTAQERLNLVTKQNPLGLILSLIALVVTAYLSYKAVVSDTTKAQKSLNEVMKEGTANATNDIAALEVLYKTATNVKLSTEERTAAVKKLKAEFPGYFGQISDEIIMNGKAAKSYHELRAAIVASARSKAAEAELERREGDRFKQREQWKEDYGTQLKDLNRLKKNLADMEKSGQITGNRRLEMVTRIQGAEKNLNNMIAQGIAAKRADQKSDAAYIDAISKNKILSGKLTDGGTEETATSTYNSDFGTDKKTKTTKPKSTAAADRRHQKEMDDMLKRGDEAAALARQIQLDLEDARIEAMNEGYDKQIDTLNLQEMRKMEEIDKKKITDSEFKILNRKIESAKGNDKLLFQALRNSWLTNNASLDELKLSEQEVFANKRQALQYKSEKEFLSDQNELHAKALGQLKKEADEEIAGYTTLAELKAGLKGRIDDKELQRITTWAQGKEALNKIYQKRELDLQVAHLEAMVKLYEGLDLGVLTPEQRKEVMKFLDEAGNKIAEFKAKAAGINQDDKSGIKKLSERPVDILGFTPEDWEAFYDNLQTGTDKLATLQMGVGALQNAFGAYYQFVAANEKKQLQQIESNTERKKRGLKTQLDQGYINQETYKKLTLKADQDLDKKKAELEAKAAKRERNIQIASTIANTAMAIMKTLATTPFPLNLIMSAVVGGIGALQLATIMRQPLPQAAGFEDGFGMEYPITREQDGKRFNVRRSRLKSGLVDRPTHFIAGENRKVEMVVDNPTWKTYPQELKNAIHSANARANGFESGFNTKGGTNTTSSGNDEIMIRMMSLMSKNIEVLEYIRDTPPIAIIQKTARNGKEVDEMRQEYLNLKNKNKH